ncbi:hypothetical protein PC120_g28198 [Phytophthora cactorum]|nr:hypothetical protein PC120_g28198 [Phytophthora cactorum]
MAEWALVYTVEVPAMAELVLGCSDGEPATEALMLASELVRVALALTMVSGNAGVGGGVGGSVGVGGAAATGPGGATTTTDGKTTTSTSQNGGAKASATATTTGTTAGTAGTGASTQQKGYRMLRSE